MLRLRGKESKRHSASLALGMTVPARERACLAPAATSHAPRATYVLTSATLHQHVLDEREQHVQCQPPHVRGGVE